MKKQKKLTSIFKKYKPFFFIGAFAVVGLIYLGISLAATSSATFTAVADSFTNSATPTSNKSALNYMNISTSQKAYLKFNINTLPAGSAIKTAKLHVYVTNSTVQAGNVYMTSSDWTETGLNWSNAPSATSVSIGSSGALTSGHWIDITIDPAYLTVNGYSSLLLVSGSTDKYQIASRESKNKPQLILTYDSPTPVAVVSPTPVSTPVSTPTPTPSSSVPCGLTVNDEVCWQQNTGVQASTGYSEAQIRAGQSGFTHISGDLTITVPNTVIDHYYIEGCIAVKANDVTIKNSLIVAQNSCAGGLQNGGPNNAIVSGGLEDSTRGWVPARNLTLSYLTINGSGADGRGSTLDNVGFSNRNIKADHLDVQGFAKGTYLLGDDSLTESYFHNVSVNAGAAGIHLEPIFLWNSSNIVIDHNYFHSQTPAGVASGGNTAAIFMKCDTANCGKNIVINNNYIRGDVGADIYGGSINGAPNYQGPDGYGLPFSITNNALDIAHSRNAINYWVTISTWTNNYNADTKAQIHP